jgi:LCP family protein required for cell wall assembly
MRTTLKRGIGRGAVANGNGRAVLPPAALSPVTHYRQPPPPRRGFLRILVQSVLWLALCAVVLTAGAAGGLYLYWHESLADVVATTPELVKAQKTLDVPVAGDPATALVIGYDKRAGVEKAFEARSDTIMLLRADPDLKTLSMLSFPRDLIVDLHCPGKPASRGRINEAYTLCGVQGTLETVRALTGLRINYLITVNFRGFKQIVAKLGGVWVDVDRRYFNDNSSGDAYATIDLQPGYQKLNGTQALDYVRYRHTDSDLYRLARQQGFVKAFNEAVTRSFGPTSLPKIINTITDNVEVGVAGGKALSKRTLLSYGLLAYQLPDGHFFQNKIEGLSGYAELSTDPANIQTAVRAFEHPDVEAPAKATAVALGRKPKTKSGPPPSEVTVLALNGNGIGGSAANASYLLGQLGYQMLVPANGAPANAPSYDYFHTKVQFDRKQAGAEQAALKVANLFGDADVEPLGPDIRPTANGAMLTVVVGQTFDGRLTPTPVDQTPKRQEAYVRNDPDATLPLLRDARSQARFPLMVPTVLQRTSYPERNVPIRVYRVAGHRTVRLAFDTGANEFWGIQMTPWKDAPILSDPNKVLGINGRRYEFHYSGAKLHMIVLRTGRGTYWVINTLLNSLSNETMIAIAKGLKPLPRR